MSNWEENENLRDKFIESTKLKLWSEIEDNDAGFSEEYVFWLEALVLKTIEKETVRSPFNPPNKDGVYKRNDSFDM